MQGQGREVSGPTLHFMYQTLSCVRLLPPWVTLQFHVSLIVNKSLLLEMVLGGAHIHCSHHQKAGGMRSLAHRFPTVWESRHGEMGQICREVVSHTAVPQNLLLGNHLHCRLTLRLMYVMGRSEQKSQESIPKTMPDLGQLMPPHPDN